MKVMWLIPFFLPGSCASDKPPPALTLEGEQSVFLTTTELSDLLRGVVVQRYGEADSEPTSHFFGNDGSYILHRGFLPVAGRFEIAGDEVCMTIDSPRQSPACFRLLRDEQQRLWKLDPDGSRTRVEIVTR